MQLSHWVSSLEAVYHTRCSFLCSHKRLYATFFLNNKLSAPWIFFQLTNMTTKPETSPKYRLWLEKNLDNAALTEIRSRRIEFNPCMHSDCKGIFISLFQYLLENIFSLSRCINSLLSSFITLYSTPACHSFECTEQLQNIMIPLVLNVTTWCHSSSRESFLLLWGE